MTRIFWVGLLVVLLAVGFFGLGSTYQTEGPGVDDTEYNLMVCFKNDGTPLYQGLVGEPHSTGGVFTFTEDNGLTRYITGATCVLTRGTTEQYSAADKAAKAGGALNEPTTSTDQNSEVDES
jgi:hypothetical protein